MSTKNAATQEGLGDGSPFQAGKARKSAPRWPQAVLGLATNRALPENRRISGVSTFLSPHPTQAHRSGQPPTF